MGDRSPLLGRKLEILEFQKCTFTYTDLPNLPSGNSSSNAAASSSTSGSANPSRKKPSFFNKLKQTAENKAEKISRKVNEIATGKDIIQRFSDDCQFRSPYDKTLVQNFVSSLELPLQLRFTKCSFEFREKSLWETIWSFISRCFGGPVADLSLGIASIEEETFVLTDIPEIINRIILNAQQSAMENSQEYP